MFLRGLEIALAQKDRVTALDYFGKAVRRTSDEGRVLMNFWSMLKENGLQEEAASRLSDAIAETEPVDPYAGRCLAEYELSKVPLGKFEASLRARNWTTAFDQRYLETYLRKLIEVRKVLPNELDSTLSPFIKQDAKNWGLYGYCLYLQSGREVQCNTFLEGLEAHRDAEAWALFHASMAQRWTGNTRRGQLLMARAAELPEDHFRKDILVWRYYDQLTSGAKIDPALLFHLDGKDLESTSRYIYTVNHILVLLQKHDFVESYQQFSPLLRECQRRIQPLVGNRIIRDCKRKLRHQIRDSIAPSLPRYQRWLWGWRLANHF
jgi:hypothetical protein